MLKNKSTLLLKNSSAERKEKPDIADHSLVLKKDLAVYLRGSFIPMYIDHQCLWVGYCGKERPSVEWLEKKYQKKIRLRNISRKIFIRSLQKNFSEHLLESSTNALANKQPKFSAKNTLSKSQKTFFAVLLLSLFIGYMLDGSKTTSALVCFCNVVFLSNTIFKTILFLVKKNKESFVDTDLKLPVYSIILPVFNEKKYVIEGLLKSIKNIDYPQEKLDVKLVVEQFDRETLSSIRQLQLPEYVSIICVKAGLPKTKPKACNYALKFVKGEFVVIYDAEDRPESKQLKKAVYEFRKLSQKLICLQARVNFYNKRNGMLSRLMSAEYRLWYDEFLAALDVVESPVPLGGTSNHFRVQELKKIGGWDSYNVTEDADLGVRIFKRGYKTKMLNSITLEECPIDVITWIKQRARWIKGHMQTYLVHARTSKIFFKKRAYFAFVSFNCFLLIPFLSFLCTFVLMVVGTFHYVSAIEIVGQYARLTSVNLFFWLAICWSTFFWVTKNMAFKWRLWVVFLSPFYFGLHSIAAIVAVIELYFRPYFWSKTNHSHRAGKLREKYLWNGQILKKLLKRWKSCIPKKTFIR